MNVTIHNNTDVTYAAENIVIVYESLSTGDTYWTSTIEDIERCIAEPESDAPLFRYIKPEYNDPPRPRTVTFNNHFIRWIARRLGRQ